VDGVLEADHVLGGGEELAHKEYVYLVRPEVELACRLIQLLLQVIIVCNTGREM